MSTDKELMEKYLMSIDLTKLDWSWAMDNPLNQRWLGCLEEKEMIELMFVHLNDNISVDKHQLYWFWDETNTNCCGPFKTEEDAKYGLSEYGESLNYIP